MSERKPLMKACDRCGLERIVRHDRRNHCQQCRNMGMSPMPEWMAHAACRSPHFNADWWWPESAHPDQGNTPLALNICGYCPVRDLCLDFAIHNREEYGIWGGLMPDGRRRIQALRKRAA